VRIGGHRNPGGHDIKLAAAVDDGRAADQSIRGVYIASILPGRMGAAMMHSPSDEHAGVARRLQCG
jgi:hypothetical protein